MDYEVKYLKNGDLVIDLATNDEDKAKYWANYLREKGYKQVHIQHSFRRGGRLVPLAELQEWASTMSQQNLLRWNGYDSKKDYEHASDEPFNIDKFIQENQDELSYIYENPTKYGIGRDSFVMTEGGAITSSFPVGFNPSFLRTPIIYGKDISLKFPNGESRRARFAIVDLDNILASHNEKSYGNTIGYPVDSNGENVNDRNYTGDVSSQAKIIEFAQDLQPDRLVTTSRTPSGTPIISIDGIVVSGNNRTMSLKLAVSDYPEKYKEYLDFLIEEISAYGFTEAGLVRGGENKGSMFVSDLSGSKIFNHPVLVRIDYDFPAYNALELSKYNKDTKKSERPIDKALKLGKQLESSEKCTSIISGVVGKYETFSEFYSNRNDQKIVKDTLVDCNILTTQELPAYFGETGFTEQGKELIENLLAGLVLSKDALIASNEGGARIFRQTIITSLPILTANKALPENSLNDALNDALIMQSKMSSSKTSFQDYVAQIGMFGEATSEEGMFMNRLLNSGRNNFKRSIEGYNASVLENQGESLFGEKPTKAEIFEAHVKNKIDPKDRKIIENSVKNIEPVKIPEPTPKIMKGNPFIDGNFFKEQPDNILAKQEHGLSRWKKPIIEYKGSLEDVKRIEAPINFIAANIETNPLVSVIHEPVSKATDVNTSIVDNLINAVSATKKEAPKKASRKAKAKKENNVVAVEELIDTYSVREVWDMINPEVSIDELCVFMWWKNNSGRPILSKEWLAIAGMTESELYNNPDLVKMWVEQGLLYYFDGELLPAYLYLAENVYDKKNRLVKAKEDGAGSGADADYIIKKYGQQVYDNQLIALDKVFKVQYDNRLMISTDSDSHLVINPVSKFAKEFMIKSLAEGNPFKWKKITAGGNKRYGMPDYLVPYVAEHDKTEFPELSLADAFCLWLRTDDTIQYQKGMNYADIIKIYVQSANKPATTASKDEFGNYVGAQLTLKKKEDAEWERLKSKTKNEGDRLFLIFLEKQLTPLDKTTIEMKWNRLFNGYVKINYNKVPVAFPCNRFDMGKPMEIRPEKREAVAFTFTEGSGLLAYDVGVGKTPSAIFTIAQFIETGYAKRPVLIVPNQTYKQWISEFKKFAGHIRINEFYNLDAGYIDDWKDVNGVTKKVAEGSVSIITYEGMVRLGFNEDTINRIKPEVGAILFQQTEGLSDKKKDRKAEKLNSQIEEMIGKLLAKTSISIEDLGFDFISFDEAHSCKKVFTSVAGEKEENLGNSGKETQSVSRYKIQSGAPSSRGVKGFMLCQYIQNTFNGNTLLLTATPFTNSPLEVYSMLAMVAHKKLKKMQLDNLNVFFDTFVATSYEMIINAKLKPERRQVILGFNNLISLQTLIRRFMNYKTGEEVQVPRPNKIVLPLRTKVIDGLQVNLSDAERVETILPLSELQSELMIGIKKYANGEVDETTMCSGALIDEEDEDTAKAEGVEIDEEVMTADEKVGVRMLKAMNHARNLALSPYIFSCSGLGTPTAEKYIKTSNKLNYMVECIRTIKEYHAKEGTDMSGVVIYMDRGVEYFKLIREYLIKNVGFEEHEVGIISSKLITPVPSGIPKDEHKEHVKNLFLGERFNRETLEMEKLSGKERCKVLIGSSTIKEGINLQKHSSCLFNCWMDWNPTDIQQLEGRIYRQGNKFKTVRIINPLMIDSMDIFMFQKLEEKTSRINTIWANEGRVNVLKTEEFNPKDLKYSLIKDANVLAEMELLEIGERIGEDIADAENKIKRNEKIKGYANTIESRTPDLKKRLQMYRPLADGQPERSLDAMLRLYQDVLKKQTDSLGKKMEFAYMRNKEKERNGEYSSLSPESKQYWFDDLNYANRGMIHEKRGYLIPNGVEVENLDGYTEQIKAQIEQLKKDKESVVSEDAIKNKANEINEKRLADAVEERTVEQCVTDFKKLNYLLSELGTPDKKIEIKMQCPPVDENGDVRIDAEGLILLDRCIEQDPDTKRMHTNEAGEYTEARQELHKRIIADMTGKTVCIDRGQPIAILTGGAPGSGKSTFLNKYAPFLKSEYIWKIDADAVREYLPEYQGWNSKSTHQETRDIVNELITSFDTPCKHDLLYDGTMSNAAKYIPLIRRLKTMGYLVFIAYMEVPKAISVERAMSRYKNNKGGKTKYGRYVPMEVIDDFFKTGKAGLEEIKHSVDGYIVVDSLTQKITEKGGLKIPQDRDYAEMFEQGKETEEPFKLMNEENELESAIEMLSELLPDLKGKEKKECQEAIEMLKEMLPERAITKDEYSGGGWVAENGEILNENGKVLGHYEFDRDSDSFWIDDRENENGSVSFETKAELIAYIQKHPKEKEQTGLSDYYDGGGSVGSHFVGLFNEQQLKNKEDKAAIELAMEKTGLKFIDSKIVKKKGKMYMEVYLKKDFSKGGPVGDDAMQAELKALITKTFSKSKNDFLKGYTLRGAGQNGDELFIVLDNQYNYDISTFFDYNLSGKLTSSLFYHDIKEWSRSLANIENVGGFEGTKKLLTDFAKEAGLILAKKRMAKGGRLKSALMRDRKYKSNEAHELAYTRKTKPKNPRYNRMSGGGSVNEKVFTKDGVELDKKSNKYRGHTFYCDLGKKFKCKGYNEKLDDCTYTNEAGTEVVGCVSGFYYNKPKKMKTGGKLPDSTEIQTLIFEKDKFTKTQAKNWCIANGFLGRLSTIDETAHSWRMRQHAPKLFKTDSFRTIELKDGVKAIVAKRIPISNEGGLVSEINKEIEKHKADDNYDEYGEEMNKVFDRFEKEHSSLEDDDYLLKATPIEALEYLKKRINKK